MHVAKDISAYRQSLRGKILETVMKAFAQKGIRAVKMDDIAKSLSISKRTLYEIYENKELLLLEGIRKYRAMQDEEYKRMSAESANVIDLVLRIYRRKVNDFKVTCPQFYADLEKYPSVMQLLLEERKRTNEYLIRFLQRGVEEGCFRKDVDIHLVAVTFTAVSEYVMKNQLYKDYSIEQIYHDIVFVSLRGYCTALGNEMLERCFEDGF